MVPWDLYLDVSNSRESQRDRQAKKIKNVVFETYIEELDVAPPEPHAEGVLLEARGLEVIPQNRS